MRFPGVQSAGLMSAMPLEGESWIDSLQRVDTPDQEGPLINLRWVSPGYFEAMRGRLVAGRFFEERDGNLNSVILSESEAKAVWQDNNPIGAQVKLRRKIYPIIEVVADSRNTSLKTLPVKMAYVHYKDQPPYATYFVAFSARAAEELVPAMRQAIWKHAPEVTIARVKTLDSQLSDSLAAERFQTLVLMSFGIAALLLAMLGRNRNTHGPWGRGIYILTLGEAGTPVFARLGTGLIASILAGRVVQKLLYGIQAVDPSVMFIVAILFLVAAVTAAFLPARRAALVDPMEALRSE